MNYNRCVKKEYWVDLIEQNRSWYFSIDSRDRKEYLYKKKSGLLQRKHNGSRSRVSKAIELDSVAEAKPYIMPPVSSTVLKMRDKEIAFAPAKLLQENEFILDTLRKLKPMEWKVIFRANHTGRILLKKNCKELKSDFSYYSVLLKLRLKDQRNFIEVGEGATASPKFNQDGLSSRVRRIVDNHLHTSPCRFSGKVPVILNAGDGAIIFHEILGHSLEADHIYRRQSPIKLEDIGKPIVSSNVTLYTHDPGDSFFKGIACDDEGETPRSETLVENGVLRHLISDCFHRNRLGIKDCGHSRVEDFSRNPMPRMFALYVKPGKYNPGELIASTPYGVYANEFGEGKVYFEKNIFYFHIRDARLIRNGKITDPLGSIIVRGNISEVLNSVEMVGNDFRYDKGISYCFKNGQTINVRVGQPSVKINNLYVTREFND